MIATPHLIDYGRSRNPETAFQEWLLWIAAMAVFDVGIYD